MLSVNNNSTTVICQFFIAQLLFLVDSWFFFIQATAEHTTQEEFKQELCSRSYASRLVQTTFGSNPINCKVVAANN